MATESPFVGAPDRCPAAERAARREREASTQAQS